MEVIINNDYVRKTCPFCKSVLGVHKEDIHVVEFETDYVICAVCGKKFSVPIIPKHWKADLYKNID